MMNEDSTPKISILDIFKDEYTETSSAHKMICPDCGLQGGRTEGFILYTDTNSASCHSSGKWFKLLEAYALKKGIIKCIDGREKGETDKKVLGGELFTLALEEFKNEFGTDKFNELSEQLRIRQRIQLPGDGRYQSEFADELADIYKTRNVLFYRGELDGIFEINRYEKIDDEGKKYIEKGFKKINGKRFVTYAEMFVRPWKIKYTKQGEIEVNSSMNETTANIALESKNLKDRLPIVERMFDIPIPILHKGELTFPKKGYDKRFGSWLPYNSPQIDPKLLTVEQAKCIIEKIFEEFPFDQPKDKTHAIAGFITPFLRGLYPGPLSVRFSTRTPVFIYMANRERAGKDYCAGCSGMLYEGVHVEEPAISNDENNSNANEEIRKKITSCMIQGKKRFHSSNNKGLLNNSVFEGVTTAKKWRDRVLGKNEMVEFDNELEYSLSGNFGIRLTADLSNRARIVNLLLQEEDANSRQFKNPDLHGWILDNRGLVISALYKLVENWIAKGKPKGSIPFASFPEWSNVCGGIMEAAGYDNPCVKDDSLADALDPETDDMKQLFEACYNNKPNRWLTKQEIQDIISNEGIMSYYNFSDRSDQTKFGIKIDKYRDRTFSGIMMKVDNLKIRSARRKFMFVKEALKDFKNDENIPNCNITVENTNVFEKDSNLVKNGQKSGNLGNEWYPLNPRIISIERIIEDKGEDTKGCQGCHPKNEEFLGLKDFKNESKIEQKIESQSLQEIAKIAKKAIQDSEPKKEKSDRELQFYESPETTGIVEECTKEQVLEFIKTNPGSGIEVLDSHLGLGSLKWATELVSEGKVKRLDNGWEVINGIASA